MLSISRFATSGKSIFRPAVRSFSNSNFNSTDGYFESERIKKLPGQSNNRNFTYFLLGAGRLVYASTARLALMAFVSSMNPAADVLALASAEFDTSEIAVGSTITVKWRGKPIFIRHRTQDEIAKEAAVDISSLRDPQTDMERAVDPEWLVVIGICTHLGCVPLSNAGDYGGWFCPCHGSHYDVSGRIRKGPAPINMELPPYTRSEDGKLVIG
mmetsp:Transcript_26957/g.59266  ORF Transcript_26957/g.59266 Transcript_26957/m.59266 type:complete len:213 (+) Transcript_26957:54-692(+)|eukprot:CAMPEP_0116889804 /NCGR_PEP_ID=MMETSP0467-20121206/349_1 /TAXON_ID=283647 /ORGANISM="Mesodinium pulex, Strain SPMC105" /LENGTH=212 /DNA_ID=CAMNT_0004556943 /DNA_START=50 /DNA_END=688 /DNA_ORIENTATION=+